MTLLECLAHLMKAGVTELFDAFTERPIENEVALETGNGPPVGFPVPPSPAPH